MKNRVLAFVSVIGFVVVVYASGLAWDAFRPRHHEPFESESIKDVFMGPRHTLFLMDDNTLWGVGSNDSRELGFVENYSLVRLQHEDGTRYTVLPIKVMSGVRAAAAGSNYSLSLKWDGTLWLFGTRLWTSYPPTDEERRTPHVLPTQVMDGVREVVAATDHVLAVKEDGSLWGIGSNAWGQLGSRLNNHSSLPLQPVYVMENIVKAFAGATRSFALADNGTLYGFGYERSGALGFVVEEDDGICFTPTPVMENVFTVAVGDNHTLILDADGTVWSTGKNSYGCLGIDTESKSVPVRIMAGAISVAAGENFSLILRSDGSLYGMGANQHGQLVGRREASLNSPTLLMEGVDSVWARRQQIVVRMRDGMFRAFGLNDYGQLGQLGDGA